MTQWSATRDSVGYGKTAASRSIGSATADATFTAFAGGQYEVWVDDALSADEAWFVRPYPKAFWWGTLPAGIAQTTGGKLAFESYAGYANAFGWDSIVLPNIVPNDKIAGQLGPTPTLSGGAYVNWVAEYDAWPLTLLNTAHGPVYYLALPGEAWTIRYFFRTFRLKLRWSDTTPIPGRWVGLGGEWGGAPYIADDGTHYLNSPQAHAYCWLNGALSEYTLTDDSGVATFLGLMGVAFGYFVDGAGWTWTLIQPADHTEGGWGGQNRQNHALFTSERETHKWFNNTGYKPWDVGETYSYRQWVPHSTTPKTAGWSIDYGTAWNATTGMLSLGAAPAIVTHTYDQYGKINILEQDGTPITATVSFGTYSGAAGANIAAVPKGSFLDNVRALPGDTPETVPDLTELPVVDASVYPASTAAGEDDQLVSPLSDWGDNAVSGTTTESLEFNVIHTGKSGNTLTGVDGLPVDVPRTTGTERPVFDNLQAGFQRGMFDGGEVLTAHYDGTWSETGGALRTGTFLIWVHEDQTRVVDVTVSTPSTLAGGLDWQTDPWGGAFLTECFPSAAYQVWSMDCEATFGRKRIVEAGILSPSRAVRLDHVHLLAGIEAGTLSLWSSTDAFLAWSAGATVDVGNAYTGCCLRIDPAGTALLFGVRAGGMTVFRSGDGGDTWDGGTACTGLGTLADDRPDVRHDGERWYALAALSDGSLALYSSPDEEAWTLYVAVAAAGTAPVLLALPGGGLLAIYHDGTGWYSRRIADSGAGPVVGSAVAIAAGAGNVNGCGAFACDRKVAAAILRADLSHDYYRSTDQGDSWSAGASG